MSNAGNDTDWRVVGTGIAIIAVSALLIMFLPMTGRRWAGVIILLLIGLGLAVAGSPGSGGSGGSRKAN